MTAATVPAAVPVRPDPIAAYRDDGPLALALGRILGHLGRAPGIPAPLLILAGLVPLLAVAAFGGGDVSRPAAAAVLAWVVLSAGVSSGSRPRRRVRWAEPPLLRATEYSALIWIAALNDPDAYAGAFALIAALTFHHYDIVYRLRQRGELPARWVSLLAGGWELRLVVAFLLLVAGALPAGYFVLAAVLGVAFVGEAIHGWMGAARLQRPLEYEDEEDEGQ